MIKSYTQTTQFGNLTTFKKGDTIKTLKDNLIGV